MISRPAIIVLVLSLAKIAIPSSVYFIEYDYFRLDIRE